MTLLCMTACNGTASSKRTEELVLPDVKTYSGAEQDALDAELFPKTGPTYCPVSKEFMKDYKVMRDETRAAQNKLK